MKKTLTLIATSTILTAAIGIPAWSMITGQADGTTQPSLVYAGQAAPAASLVLAEDDDDDEEHGFLQSLFGDHDDDEDCEHGEEDDDDCVGSSANPAPAGTTAPPQNGLFGTDTPPQVQVN